MTKWTGVSGHLSAAHKGKDGSVHGHTYKIRAWFPYDGQDVVTLKRRLDQALARYDHVTLPDDIRLGEDLAERIGAALPNCVRVDVSRPDEGFYARWEI